MEKDKRFNFRLSNNEKQLLVSKAQSEGKTISELIRSLVREAARSERRPEVQAN